MKTSQKFLFFPILLSSLFSYCKGSSGLFTGQKSPSGSALQTTTQYVDAEAGGTIVLGKDVTLSIPARALDKSAQISISQTPIVAAKDGVVPLAAYEFDEHGLEFHVPAILKICYAAGTLAQQGLNEESVAIYHNDTSGYVSYGGNVDKTTHCVRTEIYHFSTYFVAAQPLVTTNTPPSITGTSFWPSTPMIGIPLKIRSVVTDFNGSGRGQVANVWLHYCVGNAVTCSAPGSFAKVAMLPDTTSTLVTNRFTYTIPAANVTSAGIMYFFEAIDNFRMPRITAATPLSITATVASITISPGTLDIAAGFSRQLVVQAVPNSGPARDIDFASVTVGNGIGNAALNNQGVLVFDATTSGDPLTTGYRSGTVTATVGAFSAVANVNVWPGKLTAIQLLDAAGVVLGSNIALAPNAAFEFDARGLDAFGNFSLVYPSWIVTNPLIGAIPNNDGNFIATGNDGQSGQVLAIVDNIAGSVTVNVVSPPTVTLGLFNSSFSENGGVTTVTAYLSQVYASPVTVNLSFSGTALPADYIASANFITINPGLTSGDITLTGVDNAVFGGNKTVITDVTTVVNGLEAGLQQVTATIIDDETAPYVTGATPLEGSSGNPVTSTITLTFSAPMNPATLTLTASPSTVCSGAIQVSTLADNFTACVPMTTSTPAMNGTNTAATLTPASPLANNTTYKIRITNAAQGASGAPLANPVTSPNGWSTEVGIIDILPTQSYGQMNSFVTGCANYTSTSADSLGFVRGVSVTNSGVFAADFGLARVLFYPGSTTTASLVYGQQGNFSTSIPNNGGISANSLGPMVYDVFADSSGVYIADTGNNRVLFYAPNSTTAIRVYGQQGSFSSNSSNNGGVTADSLSFPTAVYADSSGVYIVDGGNSRALFYPGTSTTATRVYGQLGSFTSNVSFNGGVSADSLGASVDIAGDSTGVYIVDMENRVLFYPGASTTASRIYGQNGNFTTTGPNPPPAGVSPNSVYQPSGVAVDASGVYIADMSNARVLFFSGTDTTASRVYGQAGNFNSNSTSYGSIVNQQTLYQPNALAVDPNGRLFVSDGGNCRLLAY